MYCNQTKQGVMTARLLHWRKVRCRKSGFVALLLFAAAVIFLAPARAQNVRVFEDNADSIAVVIGNRNYRKTVSVDFAHNDADAMRAFLNRSFGFRERNIFVLKDATLSEFYQVFGTERGPQSGRLWRDVKEGRSNVFVYFSGHGVPDPASREPFLLPFDGDPNQAETGYRLDTLYRNLELVKRKVGQNRHVFVMIDACFTGETGRKGESLLAVSAPGFVPARLKTGSGLIKLLATSGASPANWDQENKLGLFTSRALLGTTDLATASHAKPDLTWAEFRRFVIESVGEAARQKGGGEQVPEIDEVALTLRTDKPVPAIQRAYDEGAWRAAEAAGTVAAYENYAAHCESPCAFKNPALDVLQARRDVAAAAADNANWKRLSAQGKYQEYLDGCGRICAFADIARRYLGGTPPTGGGRYPGYSQRPTRADQLSQKSAQPDPPVAIYSTLYQDANLQHLIEAFEEWDRQHTHTPESCAVARQALDTVQDSPVDRARLTKLQRTELEDEAKRAFDELAASPILYGPQYGLTWQNRNTIPIFIRSSKAKAKEILTDDLSVRGYNIVQDRKDAALEINMNVETPTLDGHTGPVSTDRYVTRIDTNLNWICGGFVDSRAFQGDSEGSGIQEKAISNAIGKVVGWLASK